MSRQIWKFPLSFDNTDIQMPAGAKVLTAREQGGAICVWAEVDVSAAREVRHFNIYGTGQEMPDDPGNYIGTAILHGGQFVFHVYAVTD